MRGFFFAGFFAGSAFIALLDIVAKSLDNYQPMSALVSVFFACVLGSLMMVLLEKKQEKQYE